MTRARKPAMRHWAPLAALVVALFMATSGCFHHPGGGGFPPGTTMPAHTVGFTLSEGKITMEGSVVAGRNLVNVTNSGQYDHEIIFVKAESAASLPTKADGSVDEEKLPPGSDIGELELAAGKSASKTFTFTSGKWVALCNVDHPGHVHFADGMFLEFTVA